MAIAEAYPAASPPGAAGFQTTSPVVLLSATMVASAPPGVQTSTSPSIRGDSAYAHPPGVPPNSVRRLFFQPRFPPPVSRQTRSPSQPSAYNTSPSTVGVERAPG